MVFKSILLITFSQTIIFIMATLGPGYLTEILDIRVENLSLLLLAPASLGMVAGAIIIGSVFKKINVKNAITAGFLVAGAIFIFLPFGSRVEGSHAAKTLNVYLPYIFNISILHIVMMLAFLGGFANALIYVPSNSLIQTSTHEELRGRVYGFLNALVGGVSILPVVIAGSLGDIFGVARVLIVIGIATLLVGIGRIFFE